MPGRDRTGPLGAGPRTGRGMGYCSADGQPGVDSPSGFWSSFGFGSRAGGFWGRRRRCFDPGFRGWPPLTQEQETANLKAHADWLREQLDAIQKRIDELES